MSRHVCTKCKKKRKEKFMRVVRSSDKLGSKVWICTDNCLDGRMHNDAQSYLQDGLSGRSPRLSNGYHVKSDVPGDKFILDVCCGNKMFWFNKNHPNTIYSDIKSDLAMVMSEDFRNIKYKDNSFKLVVFDPPHLFKKDKEHSWLNQNYGTLHPDQWTIDIKQGFEECFRVLQDFGVLIFKWSAGDISVSTILAIVDRVPLFGHTSDKKNRTHWMCFMKIPEKDKYMEG